MTMASPAASSSMKVDNWSRTYFDALGRRHTAHILVPVDDNGELAGKPFKCARCVEPTWKSLGYKGIPVCRVHGRKMGLLELRRAPLLPYRRVWDVCEKPLRPVWALPGLAAAAATVDAVQVPALAAVGAVPLVFEVVRRVWRGRSLRVAGRANRLKPDDPTRDKKLRAAIDAASRKAGYAAAGGTGWLAAVAALGVDPSTLAGKLAWTLMLAPWLPTAATYWHKLRVAGREPQSVPAMTPEPQRETEEQRALRIWRTVLAVQSGDIIGVASDGSTPVKATVAGRLAGTKLVGWRSIRGGWSAIIVGPPGMYESDNFLQARGKIAGAYTVGKAMVSLVPDAEDENRCALFVQRASVINEMVPWAGPDSVDTKTGTAPIVRYMDGTYGMYELFRPGWGCPHELLIGTTGSAKSSTLELLFTIDRWAHHTDPDGVKRGIIADFLVDPQQGQSFGAFVDDLAAPVASTVDEAMMLVKAFRREMLRRNKYLSRKPWTDERGRQRRGAKWWNPLVEGPMLFLTIDEAHEFLAIREFAALITAGARMYRKCGMKIRVATHTPLLTDLGGSMALRDMLTGGFVWCGRTANGLSGPTAFNGRLPADPKFIPEVPGAAYILSAREKKPMLSRTMCGPLNASGEPDFYDWVRDADNQPIGYPGVLPAETLAAFGEEYADWLAYMDSDLAEEGLWSPERDTVRPVRVEQSSDAVDHEYLREMVLWALTSAEEPLDMNALDVVLRSAEVEASTLAIRQVLTQLRGQGVVVTRDNRHELSPQARADLDRQFAEAREQVERYAEEEAAT